MSVKFGHKLRILNVCIDFKAQLLKCFAPEMLRFTCWFFNAREDT